MKFFPKSMKRQGASDASCSRTQNSHEPDIYVELIAKADAARDRRNWRVAADAYEEALALKPSESSIWVQLGNMSKETREFARSKLAYERALDLDSDNADTHLQMGHMQKMAGNKADALANYLSACELDPANQDAARETRLLQQDIEATQPIVPQQAGASPATPPTPTARPARTRSFNGRVLETRNSLQALIRYNAKNQADHSGQLGEARSAVLEAIAALERIMQRGTDNEAVNTIDLEAFVSIVFDVSDLIQYFRHHRLPTGIQRVQIEAISSILLRARSNEDVRVCCFTESADYWREVPPDIFIELCELSLTDGDWTAIEWRELMAYLDDLLASGKDFKFNQGAFLVNVGTSWWLQNYFLQVREAKQRSAIRYVPFVHDMIPIMVPEFCVEGLVKDFIGWALGVFEHADFYFVNSLATQTDLMEVGKYLGYQLTPEQIKVVALDADYRKPNSAVKESSQSLKQHRLTSGKYVLFVSTIEARKNHVAVFDAWLNLCKTHGDEVIPKLVCVGSRGWLNEAVFAKLSASRRLREKVVMLSNVSDDNLAALYKECLFSVYPSYYEGWGLPVTESLSYGKTVLVSNSSSLPEAGGRFVDYFQLADASDLLAKLERLIFDEKYRHDRESLIRSNFKPRSWQSIAGEFKEAILLWGAQSDAKPRASPIIDLGRYYAFSRNTEIAIDRRMRSGEVFRVGNKWWGAEDWGCWIKPGPAEIAFNVLTGTGTHHLYIGLYSSEPGDTPFDITVMPGKKIAAVLKQRQTKWLTLEFPVTNMSREISVVLEGFSRHEERPRGDMDPITVSIAIIGIFVCSASDTTARARFAEAVALDDMTYLAREPSAVDAKVEQFPLKKTQILHQWIGDS